ncbi:MAG: hypothetical protein AB7N99_05890 [Simkaniaceae bacterium]
MIRDTFLNFFCSESLDYGFDAFESHVNPQVDLSAERASHLILNGTFALQGHVNQWKRPSNEIALIQTIAFPIFAGLGGLLITNSIQGHSLTKGWIDFSLHAGFFAMYRTYFHSQNYEPRYQWYNQILMGGSFVLGALTLAKKCARYALQHSRNPAFPFLIQSGYEIAKSLSTFALTNLADHFEVGTQEKMVRNMLILHLVSMALIFPTEALTQVKLGHHPLDMTKQFLVVAGVFRLSLGNNPLA